MPRMRALVPGSNTIGIELPNMSRDTVWLRDLFEDKAGTTFNTEQHSNSAHLRHS